MPLKMKKTVQQMVDEANAEIETLPPDESSGTSNGELSKGDDNPDVNDLGNSH